MLYWSWVRGGIWSVSGLISAAHSMSCWKCVHRIWHWIQLVSIQAFSTVATIGHLHTITYNVKSKPIFCSHSLTSIEIREQHLVHKHLKTSNILKTSQNRFVDPSWFEENKLTAERPAAKMQRVSGLKRFGEFFILILNFMAKISKGVTCVSTWP